MDTREKIIGYFTQRQANVSIQDHTITAEFTGDVTMVQTHLRGALEAALGKTTPVKIAYYQELVNAVDIYDYRRGDEIPWQHAERMYGMPVIIHHHATGMRKNAIPNEDNPDISNTAELILPHIGSTMSGYELASNGTKKARIQVSIDGIDTYINS